METMKMEIRIPKHLKAYYGAYSCVEEAERDARLMYSYIMDGSVSIELAAEKLDTTIEHLIEYYKYLELPLNNIEKYIKERNNHCNK